MHIHTQMCAPFVEHVFAREFLENIATLEWLKAYRAFSLIVSEEMNQHIRIDVHLLLPLRAVSQVLQRSLARTCRQLHENARTLWFGRTSGMFSKARLAPWRHRVPSGLRIERTCTVCVIHGEKLLCRVCMQGRRVRLTRGSAHSKGSLWTPVAF